jgi:creatinine amidohydrolase
MADVVEWGKLRRGELAALAEAGAWVLVPVGSMEQHGEHLPVDTDTMSAWHVARSAAGAPTRPPAIVTPPIWSGLSPHHMAFPGTISLRLETLLALIADISASIVSQGFEGIVFVNGHGGNRSLLEAIALQLRHQLGIPILPVSYWDLIPEVLEEVREGKGTSIGHSGELETSIQLYLQHQRVADHRPLAPGVTDDPALGQGTKGQRLMEAAAEALADYVHRAAAWFSEHTLEEFAIGGYELRTRR